MRILHTADWHLGRIFHGLHLTGDQAHVLDQFIALARDSRPDVVIIAGDVFDRAVPPPEAVRLLDDTLARLVSDTDAHVVIIAGNHDSPARLGFGAALLGAARVHLRTRFEADPQPIVIDDEHGPVHLYPLPYAEPALARNRTGNEALREHADVFAHVLHNVRARLRAANHPRAVLAAHATVLGGEECESERPLSIGGAAEVPPGLFAGFTYVALGHLHRPQWIRGGADDSVRIRYAGSLLKYSFSEATHRKSVSLLHIDGTGDCALEEVPLTPRHDVRCISGSLHELLAAASHDPAPDDYLLAELTDSRPLPGALERLREVYPNLLQIRRGWMMRALDAASPDAAADARQLRAQPLEMCLDFLREITGEEPSTEDRELLAEVIAGVEQRQREAEE